MNLGNEYIIRFKGLKEGKHPFNFELKKPFFEEFRVLEAADGRLFVSIMLDKKSQHMELDIDINGFINVQCDRCLDYFDLPIKYIGKVYVKFSEESFEDSDDIIVLHPDDYELDIKQYLFESVGLSIPYKKIHPEDERGFSGCNSEMIDKLENLKSKGKKNDDYTDPRWDKLKNINVNKN